MNSTFKQKISFDVCLEISENIRNMYVEANFESNETYSTIFLSLELIFVNRRENLWVFSSFQMYFSGSYPWIFMENRWESCNQNRITRAKNMATFIEYRALSVCFIHSKINYEHRFIVYSLFMKPNCRSNWDWHIWLWSFNNGNLKAFCCLQKWRVHSEYLIHVDCTFIISEN